MALFGLTVEVPLFFTFFSYLLTDSVMTNLIIYRTCYVSLGYNKTECALLGTVYNNETEKLETLVEPHAAVVSMARSTTEALFSVLLCIFIGPWSDRFGRKPVLIINLSGTMLNFCLISVFSYFSSLSPWYSLVCSIPILFNGGIATYLSVILAYITDVSNEETRGVRMAAFEAVLAGGILIGNISSSFLFYATSYVWVFAVGAGLNAIGLIYTFFFIPESLHNPETQGRLKSFFGTSNMVDLMKTTFKRREYYIRAIILLNLAILTTAIFIITGEGGIMFLYVREKFHWTLTKFTLYNSATSVIWIVGTMGGTYILHKYLKIKEANLLFVGLVSALMSTLLLALGRTDWYLYAAGVIRILSGLVSPMSRTLVSKLVPDHEVGKIFSMIMSSEFFIGLGASPLYTSVYNATLRNDPAIFNFLTAGLLGSNIVLTILIMVLQRRSRGYSELHNEDQEVIGTEHAIN